MSIIVRAMTPADMRVGIKKWFGDVYNDYPQIYSRIFKVLSDNRSYVEDALYSGLPLLQEKDEAGSINYATGKQGYTPRYDHIEMALGFQISQNAIDDGIALNQAQRLSQGLARSSRLTDEVLAHQVLNRAFTASGLGLMTNGDGVALCSTTHPIRGNGVTTTFANKPVTDLDLSEAALEAALIDIGNWVDDRGNRIYCTGQKLVVNINEQFNAHRILKSATRVATADHDANAMKDMGMLSEVIATPYTTDTDAWFIVTNVTAEDNGLKFFNRKEAVIDNDNDFDTNSGKYKVCRRLSVGFSDPRGVYGSAGI